LRSIAGLMLLLWAAAPVLATFAPGEATPAERACCRKMAARCGGMKAATQSCCLKVQIAPEPAALATGTARLASDHVDSAGLPANTLLPTRAVDIVTLICQDSPPGIAS